MLFLRFYQGLSFEAIAGITGLSHSAIKMRVYRGLEKLRKFIRGNVTSGPIKVVYCYIREILLRMFKNEEEKWELFGI